MNLHFRSGVSLERSPKVAQSAAAVFAFRTVPQSRTTEINPKTSQAR